MESWGNVNLPTLEGWRAQIMRRKQSPILSDFDVPSPFKPFVFIIICDQRTNSVFASTQHPLINLFRIWVIKNCWCLKILAFVKLLELNYRILIYYDAKLKRIEFLRKLRFQSRIKTYTLVFGLPCKTLFFRERLGR